MQDEQHFLDRSPWLRAAVLGANDGILSIASLIVGVAAASSTREPIVLAGVAGIVAGALSMAAGEYVSVSSQVDIEHADIEREREELRTMPEGELRELAMIYESRGLDKELAMNVAQKLTEHDALGAHLRDELGISELTTAKPLQAAFASGAAFVFGGGLPVLLTLFAPLEYMVYTQYIASIIFLSLLGTISAKIGGSLVWKAIIRLTFWGTLAMGLTAFIGYLFGVQVG